MHRPLLLTVLLLAAPAFAAAKLPSWFPTQRLFSINDDKTVAEDYGAATFTISKGSETEDVEVRGHHWATDLFPVGPPETWTWNGQEKWKALRPLLEKQGFQVVYLNADGAVTATLRKGTGDKATYVGLSLSAEDAYSNSVRIVEPAPPAMTVTLKPPAPKPETYGEKDDFPFLTPLPGSKLHRSDQDNEPLDVSTPADTEPRLVGSGHVTKWYSSPEGLSPLLFASAYVPALEKAGWTITQKPGGANEGDSGTIRAHYQKNGRDVWLNLQEGADEWVASVADVGSSLRTALEKRCKVAVYGVNFDFDKATLRKDSEPVLQQVLALFKGTPSLKAEVGGHTDNVGKPDYNQRLSGQRAEAVKTWLVKHGVSAARLTAKGYGDSVPVVPNDSPGHRAKNRRVELKKPDCQQ